MKKQVQIKLKTISYNERHFIISSDDDSVLVSMTLQPDSKSMYGTEIIYNAKDIILKDNRLPETFIVSGQALSETNFNILIGPSAWEDDYTIEVETDELNDMSRLDYYNNIDGFEVLPFEIKQKILKGEQVGPIISTTKKVFSVANKIKVYEGKVIEPLNIKENCPNVLQFFYVFNDLIKYRKQRFNEYLHTRKDINFYSNRICYDTNFDYSKIDIAIFSYANYCNGILEALSKDCWVHYDRTDYWSACPRLNIDETALFKRANSISCSSQYLYDSLPKDIKKKAYIVENAANTDLYKKAEFKKEQKTAMYVGFDHRKVNWEQISSLAKNNPNWTIEIFVKEIIDSESFRLENNLSDNVIIRTCIPYADMMKELSSAHVGLIPLHNTDWEKGMLSLKLFDYIKCHIPVMCWDMTNYQNYKSVCFNAKDYNLDNLYNMSIPDEVYEDLYNNNQWKDRFDIIVNNLLKAKTK